ncbi:MAG: hypothetical protein ACTHN7_12870 [Solirubrobacterales bacterium]
MPSDDSAVLWRRLRPLGQAIGRGDEERILAILLDLGRANRGLAPFTFAFGGVAMLLAGLRVLLQNWRLTLVQVLPAMWVWLAMYDLRLHLVKGDTMPEVRGAVLVPIFAATIAGTIACYFLNAVFAFAVAQPGRPDVRRAFREARAHPAAIVAWGGTVGLALALATTLVSRSQPPWFALSLGIVVAVLMVTYVAVPARLIGASRQHSPRERLSAATIGAAIGLLVSAPPYLLGRIGLLMLGSKLLFVPGIAFLAVGAILQAGATGAVKAVKVSARLHPVIAGRSD